ncbi:glycosyltransferase [Zeaxanthinibacter enoshimensis]|uniref:GT2 family glycosyltransferase n=1 Tax=Zeaxanthinibacter enoshimensis TaxID=392009 RepID=A0A4V3D3W8_9FLAO|nr:glycosyltransferase [Zeaxanthinibacter enoshimensis]TDQ31623.1 GT2 family glycosyltransferase [Zeaxanthinibacter enoshimensis]
MELRYSFIVPVYNRPGELSELLQSMSALEGDLAFEVVVVEDGSSETSESVIRDFKDKLNIQYFYKKNTGPGDSRNFGMRVASGNYFIILDSDCLLPREYLQVVDDSLEKEFLDCFGGPDTAHPSFSPVQKAINYAMTSILTTGGIRGKGAAKDKFEPRSFNMGLSKKAFEATGGFGNIHPGEDPDLSIRLKQMGFRTGLLPGAYVFHKRRVDFSKFHQQIRKFGMVRPILSSWHPHTRRITYWFPSLFLLGLIAAIILALIFPGPLRWVLPGLYGGYIILLTADAYFRTKSLQVALLGVIAVFIQFIGYGYGFLKSTILVNFSRKQPEALFPHLFFQRTTDT